MVTVSPAEDEVLRVLFEQHAAPLLSYALRLTSGDRGRAEDIVQETLLRAWRHPQALDPERGPVRSWLFTVARNVAVDAHRARRARPPEVGDDALAIVPPVDEIEQMLDRVLAAASHERRKASRSRWLAAAAAVVVLAGAGAGAVVATSGQGAQHWQQTAAAASGPVHLTVRLAADASGTRLDMRMSGV